MLVIGAMLSAHLSSSPAATEDFGRDFLAEIGGMLRGFGAFGWGFGAFWWGFHLRDSKCKLFFGKVRLFGLGACELRGHLVFTGRSRSARPRHDVA